MAVKAINLHSTKHVTFPADKDDPTYWEIGALDSRTYGKLQDAALTVGVNPDNPDAEADVKMSRNQLSFEVVQFGLKGWRNFKDDKGDIPFATEARVIGAKSYDVVKADIVRVIPSDVLTWLAEQIIKVNKLTDDEGNA